MVLELEMKNAFGKIWCKLLTRMLMWATFCVFSGLLCNNSVGQGIDCGVTRATCSDNGEGFIVFQVQGLRGPSSVGVFTE